MEVFLPGAHRHEHDVESNLSNLVPQGLPEGQEKLSVTSLKSLAAGFCGVLGLALHSMIEGTATGAAHDTKLLAQMFLAIVCHKLFAVFSAGTLLKPTLGVRAWWAFMRLEEGLFWMVFQGFSRLLPVFRRLREDVLLGFSYAQ